MNWIGIVIIIALIIVGVGVYNDGWEGFKANPLESAVDSGKTIIDTGKGFFGNESVNETLVEVGMIPCAINEDCNLLADCQTDLCQCYDNGICYLK